VGRPSHGSHAKLRATGMLQEAGRIDGALTWYQRAAVTARTGAGLGGLASPTVRFRRWARHRRPQFARCANVPLRPAWGLIFMVGLAGPTMAPAIPTAEPPESGRPDAIGHGGAQQRGSRADPIRAIVGHADSTPDMCARTYLDDRGEFVFLCAYARILTGPKRRPSPARVARPGRHRDRALRRLGTSHITTQFS
jgi:hypothetical protein